MRKGEGGAVTLVTCSILLAAVLMISLGAFRNVFFHIKQSQNEVTVSQAHWLSEGGIECAYASVQQTPELLTSLQSEQDIDSINQCKLEMNLDHLAIEPLGNSLYVIIGQKNNYRISKRFYYARQSGLGTIQTRADLRLVGRFVITADAPRVTSDEGDSPCVAVRYAASLTYQIDDLDAGLITLDPNLDGPYDGFSGRCYPAYKTQLTTSNSTANSGDQFRLDYLYEPRLDTFSHYFSLAKTAHNIAKLKADYQVFSLSSVSAGHRCAELINTYLTADNNKVWIEGHCILDSAIDVTWPASLVVENGIFSAYESGTFAGSFYHMVDMSAEAFSADNIARYWRDIAAREPLPLSLGERTIYFDSGNFQPQAGVFFDALGGEAILNGSYHLDYRAALNAMAGRKVFSWLAGGWNVN